MMKKISIRLLAIISVLLISACDNLIYEDEGDCTTIQQLNFVYDYNMKYADAFAHEVTSVAAYLFDESGTLAYVKKEEVNQLDSTGYKMVLDIQGGTYDILTWCGTANQSAYKIPEVQVGKTKKEEVTCWLNRVERNAENVVEGQLPFLFHGWKEDAFFCPKSGVHTVDIHLTKNTNFVRLILQQLSGAPVDASLFDFQITDANGWMDWDNALKEDVQLTYKPWSVSQGTASMQDGTTSKAPVTEVSVALAEFTVNRLVKGNRSVLSVFNKLTGEKVLSIPLIDYALLVKGNYHKEMSDQEYLDRQDEYNMTFFLDSDYKWASAVIYINSWRVVLHDVDLN